MNELEKSRLASELRHRLHIEGLTDDEVIEASKNTLAYAFAEVWLRWQDLEVEIIKTSAFKYWLQFCTILFDVLTRTRRAWCHHVCHLYQFDGTYNLRCTDDGMIESRCYKCGAICRAEYGLALPGFRRGREPRKSA